MDQGTDDRASTPVRARSGAEAAPLVERVLRPFQQFFATSAAGGLVLLACTAVALAWANSPWAESYHHFLETPFTIGAPSFGLTLSLHAWVNDGLMAIFFLLVGLEIKREVLVGELSTRRSAALPVAAALGGMIVPALLYASVNVTGDGAAGWGIPMATDIAFALGILALLGDRIPASLRIFLAALAIADDLGAVLVIAVFYSSQMDWAALGGAGLMFMALLGLNRAGVTRSRTYAMVGIVMWLFMLKSGVHATIAGVLLALAVPARTRVGEEEFLASAEASLADFRAADEPGTSVLTNEGHQAALHSLTSVAEAAQSPLMQMEHALHGIVAFVIMPLFALANSGVSLGGDIGATLSSPIALGISMGLLMGKPIGITLASFLAVRAGAADVPRDASWRHVIGVSCLGGIGFTMSLFIANLAFGSAAQLDVAKVAVLGASALAGLIGFAVLRGTPTAPDDVTDRP